VTLRVDLGYPQETITLSVLVPNERDERHPGVRDRESEGFREAVLGTALVEISTPRNPQGRPRRVSVAHPKRKAPLAQTAANMPVDGNVGFGEWHLV
jgi:hypothetical protein